METDAELAMVRQSVTSTPSITERNPGSRSAAEFSQPWKPPFTESGLSAFSVTDPTASTFVPAIQISFFDALTSENADLRFGTASDQFSPVPAPIAPGRTWMTFAGPPLPHHGGRSFVTGVSALVASATVPLAERMTFAQIDPGS